MRRIRILIAADFHLSGKRREVIKGVFAQMLEHGPYDYALFPGDLNNNPLVGDSQASTGELVCMWQQFLYDLGCNSVIIPGQHDMTVGLGRSAVEPLANKYVHVRERPDSLSFGEVQVLCLPWLYPSMLLKPDDMQGLSRDEIARKFRVEVQKVLDGFRLEAQTAHDAGKPVILLAHCQVQGAGLPSGLALSASDRELVLTREQLIEVGADYYALGDIHKRQPLDESRPELGGYVGCVAQKDFGEGRCMGVPDRNDRPECESGFKVLTIEGGKVQSAEFIPTKAPCYYTVGVAEYPKSDLYNPPDFVRIRDYELPDDITLNDHLTFERIPPERKAREGAGDVSAETDARDLFDKWLVVTEGEAPDGSRELVRELTLHAYASDIPTTNGALGSLEQIGSITLKNIGPHEMTDLHLNNNELIGIAGDNGSGKTFLIEAVMACFYGEWPSRPGFYEQVTRGQDGEALIEIEFVSDGKAYTATRLIDAKRTQQDAYLYRHNLHKQPNECSVRLLESDDNITYNTVSDNDITAAGTYTGSKRYVKAALLETIAGPKVREFEQAIEQLVGPRELVLATIFSSQDSAGDLTRLPPRDRKAVLGKLVRAERFEPLYEAAKSERSNATNQRASFQLQRERSQELTNELPVIQQEIEAASKARDEAFETTERQEAAIEVVREKSAALKAKYKERDELEAAVSQARQDLLNAQKRVGVTALKVKDAEGSSVEHERLLEALASLADTETQLVEVELKLEQEVEVTEAKTAVKNAEAILIEEKKHAALVDDPELGCDSPSEFPPCKLMAKAVEARRLIPGSERVVNEAREAVSEFNDVNFTVLKTARNILTQRRDIGQKDKQRLAELKGMEAALPELREQLADYEDEAQRYQSALDEHREALSACEAPDEAEQMLEAQRTVAEQMLQQARETHERHIAQVAKLQERISTARQADTQVRSLVAEIEKLDVLIAQYALIAEAFGKDGIPQLLIEAAIPQIQTILDSILDGQDFRLTLSTLRELKSGKQSEALDILITDEYGEREIATASGGEKKKARLALRLALARFQAEREGAAMRVMFIDEAFDALDTDNRAWVVEILKQLPRTGLEQIFVITHAAALIAEFPMRVYLEKRGGKTCVEVMA